MITECANHKHKPTEKKKNLNQTDVSASLVLQQHQRLVRTHHNGQMPQSSTKTELGTKFKLKPRTRQMSLQ